MSFDESLQLQIRRLPVEEHNLHVNILSVFMEKVLQKMADTLVGDVAADNNMSDDEGLGDIEDYVVDNPV